jgi:glycerol-3-phosphate cytidylyltransferase/D-beta-D-heptose 7-phosphate kinase/D-beta-D-heptose 1-phosphate adenosyltransferase
VKRVIVSGYFNPLHGGHLDMIEAATMLGEHLLVVANNDNAQILKKGKIILDQQNRARLMESIKHVHEVVISIDDDLGQAKTLRMIRSMYPSDELIFANFNRSGESCALGFGAGRIIRNIPTG